MCPEKAARREPREEKGELTEQVLRQQMLVNERQKNPSEYGGMPESPVENAPIWAQPGGNPPMDERAGTVDAPPQTEREIRKEEERLQFRGG